MDRVGGLITFAATPAVLKETAAYVFSLGEYHREGMDYTEIDWPNGEVQVFRDYRRRVSAVRVARREVLAELPAVPAPDAFEPADLAPRRRDPTPPARPAADVRARRPRAP